MRFARGDPLLPRAVYFRTRSDIYTGANGLMVNRAAHRGKLNCAYVSVRRARERTGEALRRGPEPRLQRMSGQKPGPRTAAPWGAHAPRKTEHSTERSAKFSPAGESNLLPIARHYLFCG